MDEGRFTAAYAGTRFMAAYAGYRFTDAYTGTRFMADYPGVGPLGPVGPFLFGAHLGPILFEAHWACLVLILFGALGPYWPLLALLAARESVISLPVSEMRFVIFETVSVSASSFH